MTDHQEDNFRPESLDNRTARALAKRIVEELKAGDSPAHIKARLVADGLPEALADCFTGELLERAETRAAMQKGGMANAWENADMYGPSEPSELFQEWVFRAMLREMGVHAEDPTMNLGGVESGGPGEVSKPPTRQRVLLLLLYMILVPVPLLVVFVLWLLN